LRELAPSGDYCAVPQQKIRPSRQRNQRKALLNDFDLVQGLRERNPAAVQHLSDCYLPSVWRFVYVRVGGDPHLAEDIMSETVLALIRAAAEPETAIGNVEGWLRSVAGNKVVDHFRAAARVQHLIEQASPSRPTADDSEPSRLQEREEQRAEVRRVMDEMPQRHRLILEWKYLDKLSVREIGRRLTLTEKAVESLLFRARREFRDRVNRGGSDEDEKLDPGRANGKPCRMAQQPRVEEIEIQDRSLPSEDAPVPVNARDHTANS
jgi:RNA polymerase sigma factor (sigma-70 family)